MQQAVRSDATPGLVKQMVTTPAALKTRLFHTTRSTTVIVGMNAITRLLATELEAASHQQCASLLRHCSLDCRWFSAYEERCIANLWRTQQRGDDLDRIRKEGQAPT